MMNMRSLISIISFLLLVQASLCAGICSVQVRPLVGFDSNLIIMGYASPAVHSGIGDHPGFILEEAVYLMAFMKQFPSALFVFFEDKMSASLVDEESMHFLDDIACRVAYSEKTERTGLLSSLSKLQIFDDCNKKALFSCDIFKSYLNMQAPSRIITLKKNKKKSFQTIVFETLKMQKFPVVCLVPDYAYADLQVVLDEIFPCLAKKEFKNDRVLGRGREFLLQARKTLHVFMPLLD